ncbi:MAG: hypothetical protein AUH45_08920 [Gemmatimonadetes bacterium 13_1_40CM_69_22]|nr:MAG: hypothetical protein AUH45_08920 [Gemmatimonadetes bacterium 13_1_40CM_69_22]
MKCPRCSLFDIPEGAPGCAVCGYQLPGPEAAKAAPAALTELDARRELTREFRIEALLQPGDQGSSIVYLAYDPRQDRQVEVKVAPRQPLREAGVEDRFRRAAEAAAALDHPHILPIYRCGATANFLWFSTKQFQGRSVAEIVRTNGPIDLADCLRILEQVASALDYAHRRGVFHGALSSSNVVLDANEWALVGDFAVAEVVATGRTAAEVFNARGPTPTADQYGLAAVAYECLSGRPPGNEPMPDLSDVRPEIPAHVSEALRRALSSRPTERFPTVLDFVGAIGGTSPGAGQRAALFSLNPRRGPGSPVVIMDDEPEPRRVGRRLAAAASIVLALGAGGVWLSLSSLPAAPPLQRRLGAGRPPATASVPIPPGPAAAPLESAPRDTQPAPVTPSPPAGRPLPPAPQRATAPRVMRTAPPPPAVKKPAPPRATVRRGMELGRLSVNALPWGNVYVDGQLLGTVPLTDLPVWPGAHLLRVEREGFQPYERTFEIASGQRLKITDIVLRELAP